MKKKPIGYLKPLLLLLFMLSCVNLSTVCEANTHFNYTSEELSNIYYYLRATSLANSEVEDTTYHDKVVTRWESGDIIMESLTDNDWLNITTDLNNFMESYYRSSGDFPMNDGDNYKDHASDIFPYWIFAQPSQSYNYSTESINFIFVPYLLTAYEITETTSNVNGVRFYKPQSQLLGRSGDNTPTTSVYNAVMLRINKDKTYTLKTNQQGIEYNSAVASTLSGNADFFRRKNPIFYNPYTGISYPINVILAYRNNLTTGFYWLSSVGYGELVETKTNLQYNLLTGRITSGDDIIITPTPTPSGSGEKPNGGMTKEEFIGSMQEYWGTSGDLNGEKQEEEISNAVNEIMDNISGDFSNNAIVKTLESGEAGFLSFFESGHDENWYDLKFNWPDIDLDYKWNNDDVNGIYFISGDSINISAMCREVPILGTIQTLIRTIFNFSICMMLVKQIWNLLLATLGIDNPYLYENPDEEDISFSINENAGTITKTIRKGKITRRKTI